GIRNENSFDDFYGGAEEDACKWKDRETDYAESFWDSRYKNILACNVVIDALPEMVYAEVDSGKYNFLASQAYALRAYHYWCLVNTYALPWSEANLDKPGVVLRTEPQIDIAARSRSSIGDVYRVINDDIAQAEKYGKTAEFDGNIHRLSPTAVLLLASRIALFQEKWDEVIRVGNLFLEQNANILDLNAQDVSSFGEDSDSKGFAMMDGVKNKEIVFTFGTHPSLYPYAYLSPSGSMFALGFRVSYSTEESLFASYEDEDLRKTAYFKKDIPAKKAVNWWDEDQPYTYKYYYPVKYRKMEMSGASKPAEKLLRENWRSVEVILNLAEAYARKSNSVSSDAIECLNRLLRCRMDKAAFTDKTTADFRNAEELIDFIWAERRRELCFEEAMRFWDLRRQGMPELKHVWYSGWDTYETYTLKQGSGNYVLPIPESELHYNSGCVNNARELILPE
ncbi:MAG: RagB/SusD family nutrient uptake outer membrane protein, partial [Odoribacter sp.]|nr:RagB/SusD family nutrient uptake outer membrane protein [Odoribacter sp.]